MCISNTYFYSVDSHRFSAWEFYNLSFRIKLPTPCLVCGQKGLLILHQSDPRGLLEHPALSTHLWSDAADLFSQFWVCLLLSAGRALPCPVSSKSQSSPGYSSEYHSFLKREESVLIFKWAPGCIPNSCTTCVAFHYVTPTMAQFKLLN